MTGPGKDARKRRACCLLSARDVEELRRDDNVTTSVGLVDKEETLDGLSTTDAERLKTLMTLNSQKF